ncbi:MAG: hypothetical protein RLZZ231_175 [Bacteroidota bacterium]
MPFKETFHTFYAQVKASLTDGTFAKLTLAKTIGNTDLMNIYVWPIVEDNTLKLELKFKHQQEEILQTVTINEAEAILLPYINNPFMSVLLFTTEADVVYKLNKKRAVSITEKAPTFAHASTVLTEFLN